MRVTVVANRAKLTVALGRTQRIGRSAYQIHGTL